MKRTIVILLAIMMAIVPLAGCAEKEATPIEPAASGEKTTLQFYIWTDEESYITKVVDQYNATHENVEVQLTVVSANDYDDKLKVLLSGGGDVDIVDIKGMSQVSTYANAEALYDLTDMISGSNLDVSSYGPMWGTSSVNDKYYALPTRTTCWVMYYNKDIFDAVGIPYPSEQLTWAEYQDLSNLIYTTLQDKGITAADGYEIKGGMWVDWVLEYYAIQSGVYLNSDDADVIRDSLQVSYDMYHMDSNYSFEQVTATDYDYLAEFENGHVALMPNGEWMVNMFMEDIAAGKTDLNWGAAFMPIPEDAEEHTTFGDFQFVGISAKSEHPQESFDFLSYLCGEEGATIYSESGIIHAYSSDEVIDAYKEATQNDTVSVFFESKKIQQAPNDSGYFEIQTAYKENAQIYFLDEIDLDTSMTNFLNQRSTILEK
ncbi:MAG: sugar ABC transporter substrate-binding protein [Anaerolineaceae bacterium]|nr:sugar ABC transporter substrate-binding protein [Anaerolineaceae bacterium]